MALGVPVPLTFAMEKALVFCCLLNEVTDLGTIPFKAMKNTSH